MNSKVLERIKVTKGDCSISLGDETSIADTITTGTWVDMAKYRRYLVTAQLQGVASAGVVTMTLYQATSAAGAGSATLSTTVTDTATSTNLTDILLLAAECSVDDMTTSTHQYIGAYLALTNGADSDEVATITQFQFDPIYEPQSN